ncbi:MAG: dicarboxylate/amino acid:cation symporter, partial [Lawsonibacter sp.]|nr:dicarboxylate/amino acid:cation symporter [Lawsonibacter sp.]
MKKSENLPLKLLIGVIVGAALGLLIPQESTLPFAGAVVNIVGTAK